MIRHGFFVCFFSAMDILESVPTYPEDARTIPSPQHVVNAGTTASKSKVRGTDAYVRKFHEINDGHKTCKARRTLQIMIMNM